MQKKTYVWDPLVRIFHWSLVVGFVAQALIIDEDSNLHITLGYVVAGLIAVRIIWGFIGSKHARFSDFPPSPHAAMGQLSDMSNGRHKEYVGHNPLGAMMIYNLLILIALISLTGYMMTTSAFFGVEWVEEVHEMLVVLAEVSVVIHIAAVILESRRSHINLPKAMVTGYKTPDNKET